MNKRPVSVGIACWQALSNLGATALDMQHALLKNQPRFQSTTAWLTQQRAVQAGHITNELCPIPAALQNHASRNVAIALTLVQSMADALSQQCQGISLQRLGIVIGTSTSGMADNEAAIFAKKQHQPSQIPFVYSKQQMNATSSALQAYLGWQGPCFTISTACSSAAKAMLAGQRLLHADLCDAVLVGGIDSLCSLTFNGFDSLESLSQYHCQPFAAERDGINIGEAGALFLLTHAQETHQVLLKGGGESSDAWHISAPHPEGVGAAQAMQNALDNCLMHPEDIDYINLHGTGTPQNDAMEALAIRKVFPHLNAPISSTKHITGHCLGAAGAIEAAICCAILQSDVPWLPPQQHSAAIEACFQDLPFVNQHTPLPNTIQHIMSNSFAFAGSNVSLIFEAQHA